MILYVDGSDGDNRVTDEQQPGCIILKKQDANGRALSGATYKLEYAASENGPWNPVTPYSSYDGGILRGKANGVNSSGELTTGRDGKIEFTGLLADGTIYYRVTEVGAPDGYQLLAEPFYVGTLPQTADDDLNTAKYDINGDGAADEIDLALLQQAVDGHVNIPGGRGDLDGNSQVNRGDLQLMTDFLSTYLKQNVNAGDTPFNRRYILSYAVTDGAVFELPHTGSKDFRWIWMVFAFAGLLGSGSVVILSAFRRKDYYTIDPPGFIDETK